SALAAEPLLTAMAAAPAESTSSSGAPSATEPNVDAYGSRCAAPAVVSSAVVPGAMPAAASRSGPAASATLPNRSTATTSASTTGPGSRPAVGAGRRTSASGRTGGPRAAGS